MYVVGIVAHLLLYYSQPISAISFRRIKPPQKHHRINNLSFESPT